MLPLEIVAVQWFYMVALSVRSLIESSAVSLGALNQHTEQNTTDDQVDEAATIRPRMCVYAQSHMSVNVVGKNKLLMQNLFYTAPESYAFGEVKQWVKSPGTIF